MKRTDLHWQSSDGLDFYGQEWRPNGEPRAAVCLVHGLGEHCGRYAHVGLALAQAGYAFLAVDLRGHGKSAGQRGHVTSFEVYLGDIDQQLLEAQRCFPGRPCFLYGHSLGATLALDYAISRQQAPLAGVIATAPSLRTPLEQQTLKVILARVLNRLWPTGALHSGLDPATLSRNPAVVTAYRYDPLVHDLVSFRSGLEGLRAGHWALEHAAEFPALPLLIMHGGADRLCIPAGSHEFASQVRGDCTLKVWDGLYHEIHNEPEQRQVLQFMIDWLNARTVAA